MNNNLQKRISDDLTVATLERNKVKRDLLKVVISEMSRGISKEIDDTEAIRIIKKIRDNSIECGNHNEAPILEEYLPKMFTYDVIEEIVKTIIESMENPNMGMIMKALNSRPDSQFIDRKMANDIIKNIWKR